MSPLLFLGKITVEILIQHFFRKFLTKVILVESVSEWMTMKEAQELFGMSAASVRSNAYRHHIPTKREYARLTTLKTILSN